MDEASNGNGDELPLYGRLREPNHRVRHDGWTGEKQRGFLEALGRCGNVRDAVRAVGMSNVSAYRLRKVDPAFGEAWDAALKRASVSLEAVAFARAVEGAEEVVIRRGEEVSRKRKPSDSLLRMLLQASNPEKYGRVGPQPSVKAREEVEARVQEIEEAAYRRAWRALVAEYHYRLEPEYIRHYMFAKIARMHFRICENPFCADCHPGRGTPGSPASVVPDDHRPLSPPDRWLGEISAALQAQVAAMIARGEQPELDDPAMPEQFRYPNAMAAATPPPFSRYAPEEVEPE